LRRILIGVEIARNDARSIEPGQAVEVAFKFMPGKVPLRQTAILNCVDPF
jgi:hypothetical protein